LNNKVLKVKGTGENMVLNDRDMLILRNIGRWRVVLGRHLKELANFTGARACERRLKILFENKLIARLEHKIYGDE